MAPTRPLLTKSFDGVRVFQIVQLFALESRPAQALALQKT